MQSGSASTDSAESAATSCARRSATRTSTSSRSTISRMPQTLAHLLKYDSVLGNLHAKVEATERRRSPSTATSFKVLSMRDPAQLPWKDLGVDVVFESTGLFTNRDDAAETPDRRREEGRDHRARQGPGHHRRSRRQRGEIRSGEASDHLERVVHDELPGAARQGASPDVRHQEGLDDDHPLVHERPAVARPAAQGSASCARRGAVDDSDDDRRGRGGGRGAAGAEGQARRLRDARADAERVGGRPRRASSTRSRPRRGSERGAQEPRRTVR